MSHSRNMATARHYTVQALLLLAYVALPAESFPIPASSEVAIGKRQSSGDTSSSNGDSNVSPKVWVPAVAVVLVLLGIFCFIWTRTSVMDRMRGVVSRSANSTSNTQEVTASQLAGGSNNASGANGTSNANSGSRSGRTRRNRRRASQMSATTLPVYMKEPGDMELVIFRGPEEMDASNAIAEAREAEEAEDTEEDDRDQTEAERDGGEMRENRSSGLLTVPVHGSTAISPDVSMQSLGLPSAHGGEDEADTSTTQLLSSTPGHQRTGSGGMTAEASTTSIGRPNILHRVSEVPTPIEAPPGYNSNRNSSAFPPGLVVSSGADTAAGPNLTEAASAQARARSQTPNTTQSRLSQRISRILHLRSGSGASNMSSVTDSDPAASSSHLSSSGPSPEPPEPAHVSAPSSRPATNAEMTMRTNLASVVSLNDLPTPPSSSGITSHPPVSLHHSRHRTSQSGGSSSTLNLVMPFRTISRQRSTTSLARPRDANALSHSRSMVSMNGSASGSNANLTSPSLLSLSIAQGNNPISAPLSHTLVRTEIRYPAGGPTPDQIKLLSSREGFERFAMPYGEDAVAHAQRSRADLLSDPPPNFESPTTEVGRSAARDAREAREAAEGHDSGSGDAEGRGSTSSEGPDPDALPEGFNTSITAEEEAVNASIDARMFLPMFM